MSAELIREHYDYHRWANRRLFDVAHSLGTEATGRDLDVAIEGDGFLTVQGSDGNEAYTRNGSFQVTSDGELQTRTGLTAIAPSIASMSEHPVHPPVYLQPERFQTLGHWGARESVRENVPTAARP